ncbi:ureidoglycolate lyase [Altererythrobacter sp. GH1-8]|uniref:ureidoglycolate lyase n=1 Tax=Altererythrobacter sp. GH1-8 TaxID=3349333 RepID=UPI00374C93B6
MTMTICKLDPIAANRDNFAPFGRLIEPDERPGRQTSFYNDAVDLWDVPGMVTDREACIAVARVRPRPRSVIWLERHFQHTQVFMPLNGAPFFMVLAPPNEESLPDPDKVVAFAFDGTKGVMLDIGTWHEFPFAAAGDVDFAIFLREELHSDLEQIENGEAMGGDLEKRNIQTRLGLEFVI